MKTKGFLALGLSLIMTLSLVSCGKEDSASGDVQAEKEFVYVPEYITIGEGNDEGYSNFSNFCMTGNSLYYSEYIWDDVTQEQSHSLHKYSMEDGTTETISLAGDYVNSMAFDRDGNRYDLLNHVPEEPGASGEYKQQFFLNKYDKDGNVIYEQEITEALQRDGEIAWPQNLAVDDEGKIYLGLDGGICLLDETGSVVGIISMNGWISSMASGKDGKMYIAYNDYESAEGGMALAEVDFAGKKLGNVYKNLPGYNMNGMVAATEKTFLINMGTAVYEYHLETQTAEEMFSWLDSDINGDYVRYIALAEDGRIFAPINDWNTNATELAMLTKTKASEVPRKEQIVFGAMYDNQSLRAAAVEFNKKSDNYHVTIKVYVDETNWTENTWQDAVNRLQNDLTSEKNCPDIVDVTAIDESAMVAKGVFEDLYPYLEQSSVLSKDDFLENVLEQFSHEGKLVSIPKTFQLNTIAGKRSVVGDKMGWTLEDMMALKDKHPDAKLFNTWQKSSALFYCMMFSQDAFVDWNNVKCNFDSDEFKRVLEFVNTFPTEIDWENYDDSTELTDMQSDKVLLDNVNIGQIEDVQFAPFKFGEEVTYIGFPVMDGGVGCTMSASNRYAIVAQSAHKEGAWAFIESYLTTKDTMFAWGFPTLKKEFNQKMDEACNVKYMLDGNGEQMLDEEGNPIPEGGTSSIGGNGWSYTYQIPTKEDVELVKMLLSVARPEKRTNDELMKIIQEEATPYFEGQKTLDEVAGIIQSRAQIFVSENS